jgi:Lung surfactant protein D coiled-coil trimerisation
MADAPSKDDARRALDAHGSAIDALHQKLASSPGVDKQRLQNAVSNYKKAHQTFTDDALGCMN